MVRKKLRLISGTKSITVTVLYPQKIKDTPTQIGTFFKRNILLPGFMEGALKHSGEWFQKHADSVSGFTGFMWTKNRYFI